MDAEPVALVEDDARGPKVQVERIDLAGFEQLFNGERLVEPRPEAAFADIEGATIRIDITNAHEEIRIRRVARNPEFCAHVASDFHRLE